MTEIFSSRIAAGLLVLLTAQPLAAAEIVANGSFEQLSSPFVDDGDNYMTLGNGSTTLTGWTVSTSAGAIVVGRSPTGDGYNAANGTYFIDLSGFGASSPDGAVSQTLGTAAGVSYAFSMAVYAGNDGTVSASVGGQTLSLVAGAPFSVGGTEWIPKTTTFTGDPLNLHPVLSIANDTPGSELDFVDNISIIGPSQTVPEPSTWAMILLGFAGLAFAGYRWAREPRAA